MPTASVARMPPSTPHNSVRPATPSPKMPVTSEVTAGDTQASQAPVSRRASRSPTTKSVMNIAAMTPMRIGMPVRGDVVSRHQAAARSVLFSVVQAAAMARAAAWRALAMVSGSASSSAVSAASGVAIQLGGELVVALRARRARRRVT